MILAMLWLVLLILMAPLDGPLYIKLDLLSMK